MLKLSYSKKGFTLIELVIVIALLAVLTAIAIPVVTHTINMATRDTAIANADVLDEQLMLAKADVDTGNEETFGAKAGDATLTIGDVVKHQAISEACNSHTYNGKELVPVWNFDTKDVEVMCMADNTNIETGATITNFTRITETSLTLVVNLS